MASEFEGKVVLVTGGASGIGAACVRQFAAEGARVLVADTAREAGAAIADALPGVRFRHCDVTSEAAVAAAIEEAISAWGALDCAVNCAGVVGDPTPLESMAGEQWRRVLDINLSGVFYCLKHELAVMKPRGSGAIVNVSSGAGLIATPWLGAYCASKHGVLGLTKTAAMESVKHGVRVNAVLPGSTRTPMLESSMQSDPGVEKMILDSVPGGRLGDPGEIAEAVVWLCGPRASFVNGHSMLVDGGSVSR